MLVHLWRSLMPWTHVIVMNSSINLMKSPRTDTVRLIIKGMESSYLDQKITDWHHQHHLKVRSHPWIWYLGTQYQVSQLFNQFNKDRGSSESPRELSDRPGRLQSSEDKWEMSYCPFALSRPTCQHELELFISWSHSTSSPLSLIHLQLRISLYTQEQGWTLEQERERNG